MSQKPRIRFLRNLAAAFYLATWADRDLRGAAARATGRRYSWAIKLVQKLIEKFPEKPSLHLLELFIQADAGFNKACEKMLRGEYQYFPVNRIYYAPGFALPRPSWAAQLPELVTPGMLADWLEVTEGQLEWLADLAGINRLDRHFAFRTYRYRWIPKKSGRARLLEIPMPMLKKAQRKVLSELLDVIPVHDACHGFRPGRSVLTNAEKHCGRAAVIHLDLKNFFTSVSAGRVFALFRTLGYRHSVGSLLAGLCTSRVPRSVWATRPNPQLDGSDHSEWQRLGMRHLPQGAPTSPAIANLAAFRLDRRLEGLAGELDAVYTRYADDITFSGSRELARSFKRLAVLVTRIAVEEGFALNHSKTRLQCRSGRQKVTGIVVNGKMNVPRPEYDHLKAVLTNCIRHGPGGQNRNKHPEFRSYLMGKVSHFAMINPVRGQRLWGLFDRIVWPDAAPVTGA